MRLHCGGRLSAGVATALLLGIVGQAAARDGDDPAAVRTRIVVIGPAAKDSAARPVVMLAKPSGAEEPARLEDMVGGILARELFRQALLIAARDEMGLATRDEVLGDPPAAAGEARGELVVLLRAGDKAGQLVIRRPGGPAGGMVLERDVPGTKPPHGELPRLLEAAEALSRTGFPAALRQLGPEGKANAIKEDAGLPPGVEERLGRIEYIEAFMAVRALHQAIRTGGESSGRLAGLVRGYAMLGLLTEHHWHPAHEAFKARALLYAQRMVARDPKGYSGLWHRAYAESLIGLHKDALSDIALARQRARAAGDPIPPAWAGLIEANARGNLVGMVITEGPLAPLSALLRLLALEPTTLTDLGLLGGKEVQTHDKECYRAYDAMCRLGELLNNIDAPTSTGPAVFDEFVPKRLGTQADLPAIVRGRLDKASVAGTAMFAALGDAGAPGLDDGEPSWSVLGRMLRETRYVQVWRNLMLRRGPLGTMAANHLKAVRAGVADHPFVTYLDSLAVPRAQAPRVLEGMIGHLDLADLQLRADPMLEAIEQTGHPAARAPRRLARRHVDNTAHDLAELVRSTGGREQTDGALALLEVSPSSPYGRAILIEKDWERARPHIAEWEKEAERSPVLLAALARRYAELGQVEEARRVLFRYIRFSPDQWAYERLAGYLKDAGDVERWRMTLDEFLAKTEDNGRSHAKVRVQVAEYYMGLGHWDEAWPYAEAAALSGAHWALVCALRCAEGRRDYAAAERYYREISQRNPNGGWAAWYLFCKRTGHGDVQAAGAFAEQALATAGDRPGVTPPAAIGYFHWLRGDLKRAAEFFRKAYDAAPSQVTCVPLILIADEASDVAARDEWTRTLLTRHRQQAPNTARIFEVLQKAGGAEKLEAADLEAIDNVLGKIQAAAYRGNNAFYAGCYLKNHGQRDAARRHLEIALRSTASNRFMRALAADRLQKMGVDVQVIGAGPDDPPPPAAGGQRDGRPNSGPRREKND